MRARIAAVLLCVTLAAGPAVQGCDEEPKRERKRALLQPPDAQKRAAEAREKRRLFDERGELIPSGEKVAGVMLPKGLTLYRRFEQQSFYKGDRIPFEKLDRFFSAQLMSTTVERMQGSVVFGGAVPKNNLRARRIDLRISRLRGAPNAIEVYVREPKPFTIAPPPEQDQANLENARRYAD